MVPYEFRFATAPEAVNLSVELEEHAAFFSEVQHVLRETGSGGIIGLRAIPMFEKENLAEVNQDRWNTNIPVSKLQSDGQDRNHIEATWFFDGRSERA